MRYLEQCVSDLKANSLASNTPGHILRERSASSELTTAEVDEREMEDVPLAKLGPRTDQGHGQETTNSQPVSPAVEERMHSPPSMSSSAITLAIPPRTYSISSCNSLITSPITAPQPAGDRDLDHEASEALLLLNSGRRGSGMRGMSVKDLLGA